VLLLLTFKKWQALQRVSWLDLEGRARAKGQGPLHSRDIQRPKKRHRLNVLPSLLLVGAVVVPSMVVLVLAGQPILALQILFVGLALWLLL
jgi:hypothetical protein